MQAGCGKSSIQSQPCEKAMSKNSCIKSKLSAEKAASEFYCRGKYALNEPKAYNRHTYAVQLQRKLFSKPSLGLHLRKGFTQNDKSLAQKMSKGVLTKTVIDRVCKKHRERVAQLLKCVRLVNSFEISRQNLGERWHTASSEPFFYDTTYMPVQRDNAVPVDENGQCCTAEEVGDREKNTMRPKNGNAQRSANCLPMRRLVLLLQQRNCSRNQCSNSEKHLSP